MVTGISAGSQATYVGRNSSGEITVNTNTEQENKNNIIEDTYIPSINFDYNYNFINNIEERDSDFYMALGINHRAEDFLNVVNLDSFKSSLKTYLTDEYEQENLSLSKNYRKESGLDKEAFDNYLENIDYEKEFKEFMASRDCKNESELQAMSKSDCWRKKDFLERAAFYTVFSTNDRDGLNLTPEMIKKTAENMEKRFSLDDLVTQWNSSVGTIQNETKDSGTIDDMQPELTQRVKDFSNKLFGDVNILDLLFRDNDNTLMQDYNSSLIAKYAS